MNRLRNMYANTLQYRLCLYTNDFINNYNSIQLWFRFVSTSLLCSTLFIHIFPFFQIHFRTNIFNKNIFSRFIFHTFWTRPLNLNKTANITPQLNYLSLRMYSNVKYRLYDSTETICLFYNNCDDYLRHFTIIVYRYHKLQPLQPTQLEHSRKHHPYTQIIFIRNQYNFHVFTNPTNNRRGLTCFKPYCPIHFEIRFCLTGK